MFQIVQPTLQSITITPTLSKTLPSRYSACSYENKNTICKSVIPSADAGMTENLVVLYLAICSVSTVFIFSSTNGS